MFFLKKMELCGCLKKDLKAKNQGSSILIRVCIDVKGNQGHDNSHKGKHLTGGWHTVQRFSLLSPWWEGGWHAEDMVWRGAESFTSGSPGSRKPEWNRPGLSSWHLKTQPQWHTFSNRPHLLIKTTSPNSAIPYRTMRAIFIQTNMGRFIPKYVLG